MQEICNQRLATPLHGQR